MEAQREKEIECEPNAHGEKLPGGAVQVLERPQERDQEPVPWFTRRADALPPDQRLYEHRPPPV